MNDQERRQFLKAMASGGTRTVGRHPDYDRFMHAAARAILRKDYSIAMVLAAEADNAESRMNMKRRHCSNLGPHAADNPSHCIHCGKPREQWIEEEECIP